jgi:hypothetical protein
LNIGFQLFTNRKKFEPNKASLTQLNQIKRSVFIPYTKSSKDTHTQKNQNFLSLSFLFLNFLGNQTDFGSELNHKEAASAKHRRKKPNLDLNEDRNRATKGMPLSLSIARLFLSQSHGSFSLNRTLFCFSFLSLTVARVGLTKIFKVLGRRYLSRETHVAVIFNRKLNGCLVEVSILRIHKLQVVIMRN